MKRLMRIAALTCCLVASIAVAQEHEGKQHEGGSESAEGGLEVWKWANFLVLAVGLGYVIVKNVPAMFAARSLQIRKEIVDAEEARREADEKTAAVQKRLANLETEIEALRQEARDEDRAETESVARQAAAEIAKIQANAQQEIESAGKAARIDLKRYAATLAVDLAERKVRARMTPAVQDSMVQSFVRDLK